MKKCKCGSFAINDDKTGEMCDKCLRDNKIKQLEKERDEWKGRVANDRPDIALEIQQAERRGYELACTAPKSLPKACYAECGYSYKEAIAERDGVEK